MQSVDEGERRRRTWSADKKQRIIAESFAPGAFVAGVARRYGLNANMLSSARKPSALLQEDPEERRTIRPGNCSELVVWRMWLVRRRIDPIGTGFAKEMPSRETKRTWHPVKSSAFANPSCVVQDQTRVQCAEDMPQLTS